MEDRGSVRANSAYQSPKHTNYHFQILTKSSIIPWCSSMEAQSVMEGPHQTQTLFILIIMASYLVVATHLL